MILKLLPFLWLSASAYCTTLTFASQGTAANVLELNSRGFNHTVIPNPAWAPALPGSSWVSFEQSGDPNDPRFVSPPNGQLTYFEQSIPLGPGNWSGSVSFMADDSAALWVNARYLLVDEASRIDNSYRWCSDFAVGCRKPFTVEIPAGELHEGTNFLTFVVAQRAGSSFGLDYVATITDGSTNRSVAPTPEPGTFGLIGIAGILIGVLKRRKYGQSQG